MGILLCLIALAIAVAASRRSNVAGITAVIGVGYFYGIIRANVPESATHFVFDFAVLGLYVSRLFNKQDAQITRSSRSILLWVIALSAWPAFVALFPLQDPLVQLVGLRGSIFLLPFLLFGARLTREEVLRISMNVAILNLIVFSVAAVQYRVGIEAFFPRNANTEIIYRSADVGGSEQYRIPGTFSGSHAYAGAMVMSLPLLIGAWAFAGLTFRQRILVSFSLVATILGVFAAASRVHTIVLGIVLLATLFSTAIKLQARAVLLTMIAIIAIIVLAQERLQRFTTLQDSSMVSERFSGSVNSNFFELLVDYPFGNGLGGGGTSLPYFLQDRVQNRVTMENEYARILLEQSVLGLCLWMTFIAWLVGRRFSRSAREWGVGQQLGWVTVIAYFGTGLIGTGLLTSIPQTVVMLMLAGWFSAESPALELGSHEVLVEYAVS